MTCPTCGHTMHSVRGGILWCPRCGTARDGGNVWAPELVDRCRRFEDAFRGSVEYHVSVWVRLGIHDAINTPAERARDREGL